METVICPGNGSRYWVIAGTGKDGVPWVALPDYGRAARMEWRRYVTPGYAAEKLGLAAGDAEAVAEILSNAASAAEAPMPRG